MGEPIHYQRIQDPELRHLASIADARLLDALYKIDKHAAKTPERKKEFGDTSLELYFAIQALLDLIYVGFSKTRLGSARSIEREL